jgi:hypothetical protein
MFMSNYFERQFGAPRLAGAERRLRQCIFASQNKKTMTLHSTKTHACRTTGATIVLCIALMLLAGIRLSAQSASQIIRGKVSDQQSKAPIPSVSVEVIINGQKSGTVTDIDGAFELSGTPLGRVTLHFNHLSYQELSVPDVLVESGKETVVNVEMLEKVVETKEITIKAKKDKITDKQMATVSASVFNAEDTRRFAGSRNDVARMAGNFSGVVSNNDSRNDIIVRGNAPTGLLWRIEGIDVPNPNHFGQSGATGGPVSMINNNVLDKSAFYTSAFPAQFGNATAGVFDIQLRDGNAQKREFTAELGLGGLEFGAEGYFAKNNKASYLINYRYSVPGLMHDLGITTGTGSAVPHYQDLSLKICLPTKKAGKFTLFGVGGLSSIDFKGDIKDTSNFYNDPFTNLNFISNSGVVGLSNMLFFNSNTSSKFTIAATGMQVRTIQDSLNDVRAAFPTYREHTDEGKYVINETINKKFSSKDRLTTGFTLNDIHYHFADSNRIETGNLKPLRREWGSTQLIAAYASWQHRFTDKMTLNTGIYSQLLTLNNTRSIEPRVGARYQLTNSGAFNFGFGRHSQMQDLMLYFLKTPTSGGTFAETNHELKFTQSNHFVLGWEQTVLTCWHYKAEIYYQALSDVPVNQEPTSFSALNLGATYGTPKNDSLVSIGRGRNYGIEVTIDKPFSNGFYVTATASLFNSLYTGSDNVERNTAFNNNYVINFLAGKEWKIGRLNAICLDGKLTAAGGKRYTTIDLPASIAAHGAVYDDAHAYSRKFGDYPRADVKITYKMNGRRVMQEIYLDMQNITNMQNALRQGFDNRNNIMRTQYQLGFTPTINYRIQF